MKSLEITKNQIKELESKIKILIEDFISSNGNCDLKLDVDNIYEGIRGSLFYVRTDVKISITI